MFRRDWLKAIGGGVASLLGLASVGASKQQDESAVYRRVHGLETHCRTEYGVFRSDAVVLVERIDPRDAQPGDRIMIDFEWFDVLKGGKLKPADSPV